MPQLIEDWILAPAAHIPMVLLSFVAVYAWIILLTRITGVRSFAKMSSFDFAMTIAIGSLFATTIVNPEPPLARSLVAFAALFGGQWLVAQLRIRSDGAREVVDNSPILVMRDGVMLKGNMRRAEIAETDLVAKLREANVLHFGQVRAVVVETSGDVSVLHASDDTPLAPALLEGVRGADEVAG